MEYVVKTNRSYLKYEQDGIKFVKKKKNAKHFSESEILSFMKSAENNTFFLLKCTWIKIKEYK